MSQQAKSLLSLSVITTALLTQYRGVTAAGAVVAVAGAARPKTFIWPGAKVILAEGAVVTLNLLPVIELSTAGGPTSFCVPSHVIILLV